MTIIFKVTLFIITMIIANPTFSQSTTHAPLEELPNHFIQKGIYQDKVALKVSYFGELILHPGLSLGIDYTLSSKNRIVIHWDTEIGGYWHRWNHTALFFKTSLGARVLAQPMFVDFNIGLGYMHSFAAGTIYHRDANGGIKKAPNWGSSHFMPSASLLLGWCGSQKRNSPIAFHIGIEAYYQSHFNHILLPHIAGKMGLTYQLKKHK